MKDVLIFSGTTEGRTLSEWLASRGVHVHARVATDYGACAMGGEGIDVEAGSCGGAEGIASVIRDGGYSLVVDATHPYATRISEHIRRGCEMSRAECIRLRRGCSHIGTDGIVEVGSVQEAVDYLKGREGRILATTGSNDIGVYTGIPGYRDRVVARVLSTASSVQRCAEHGFEGRNLICGQGPFTEEVDYATLRSIGARYIVTKDSGAEGGFDEKVRAARRAGAEVVLVKRPEDPGHSYSEVVGILEDRLGLEHADAEPAGTGRTEVRLIGMGTGGDGITVSAMKRISEADVLIGAGRMLGAVDSAGRDVLAEYDPNKISDFLEANPQYGKAAVLLSGDVGFYSGAKKLLSVLDEKRFDVTAEPGVPSLAYFCSKLRTSWDDALLISAHGRHANVVGSVRSHPKVLALLSGEGSVEELCGQLSGYGLDVRVSVGMDLGLPTEKIAVGTPSEMMAEDWGRLCVAMVENPDADPSCPLCIPDEQFVRGDAPMTKSEARALSVAKLRLRPDSVVYDIGAGTGSVSVEMALVATDGTVYAVERDEAAVNLIRMNMMRFKTPNVEVVQGTAPEALEGLPVPTHAFIGGSGGDLKKIVGCLLEKNPHIRMVINSVTAETMSETFDAIRELNLREEDVISLNVARARRTGRYHLMTAQNPVCIAVVTGR